MTLWQWILVAGVGLIVFLVAWRFRARITNTTVGAAALVFVGVLLAIFSERAAKKVQDVMRKIP